MIRRSGSRRFRSSLCRRIVVAEPTLFHNPRCSKSRGAKQLLDDAGVSYEIVEYLKAPPTRAQIEHLVDSLIDEPATLVRTGEASFKQLGVDKAALAEKDAVVDLLTDHPELMERPVLVVGDRAVIGRPPERVRELL
jgi:arsenate reductase (glutaredoxin)